MVAFFVIGFGITLIVMLNNLKSNINSNLRVINRKVVKIQDEIEKSLSPSQKEVVKSTEKVDIKRPEVKTNLEVTSQKLPVSDKAFINRDSDKIESEPKKEVKEQKKIVEQTKPKSTLKEESKEVIKLEKKETPKAVAFSQTPTITPKPKTGIKPKEPRDYEKLIGENWLNKIGIAVLVLGIGFFVKYAIDKNWIGELGRVGIGMSTGGILMGIAHFLKNKYRAFSSVLIGGGISVFYYTISIAYHDYGIFSQKQAFGIMSGITLLSVIMSLWYNRKELAIIGLIGGFTTPFMVQGETNNFFAFFTYIAILNSGMLILSYFKKWNTLHKLSLGFTVLFFGAWMLIENVTYGDKQYAAILFSSIYFVQFLGINLWYNLAHKVKFNAWELIQILSTTALYYGGMMYLLNTVQGGDFQGAFTIIMAVVFLGIAILVKSILSKDEGLVNLLIGKVITFITLSVLIQFNGDYITLFWSIEAVVLLWIGQKTKMSILKNASVIVTGIAVVGIIKDWVNIYLLNDGGQLSIVFSEVFMTSVISIGAIITTIFLLKKEEAKSLIAGISATSYRSILEGWTFIAIYLTILLELIEQIGRINYHPGEELVLWSFHFALIIAGMVIGIKKKSELLKQIFFIIGIFASVGYVALAHPNHVEIRNDVLSGAVQSSAFYLHFILVGLFIGLLVSLRKLSFKIFENNQHINIFLVFLSLFGLFLATAEMDQIAVYGFADSTDGIFAVIKHTRVSGYTVLWGIYSFILMVYGMRKKERFIRVFSLIIFSVTLVKLFAFDISNISEGGKILAFISLGILLLIVSFLYQKLKQIIVDGEVKQS